MSSPGTQSPLTEREIADYHRDGYHIACGFVGWAEVARIRETFMEYVERGPDTAMCDEGHLKLKNDPLSQYPRLLMPHRFPETPVGSIALKYLLHPGLKPIVEALLGGPAICAQTMFYFKPPTARGQNLHQDNNPLRVNPGTCLAAWIAIDDADPDNGGMIVVPGSHRLDLICPGEGDLSESFSGGRVDPPSGMHEEALTLKAGDVLFFNGSVIHGSYLNRSETRFRRALINHYASASCEEIAGFYHPLLDYDGQTVERKVSTMGGPCGETAL